MKTYGYARVSTVEQSLERQVEALEKYGCDKVYSDNYTGSSSQRPGLLKLLKRIENGDRIVVQKIDRLGRSIQHLIELMQLFKDRNIEFISIMDNIDTTTAQGRLIFHIMATIAEFERELIKERIIDGIANARRKGVKFGRPAVMNEDKWILLKEYQKQGINKAEIIHRLEISNASYYRALKLIEI
jgi:DNA invertase Pin-like site-specific DNA recombinase